MYCYSLYRFQPKILKDFSNFVFHTDNTVFFSLYNCANGACDSIASVFFFFFSIASVKGNIYTIVNDEFYAKKMKKRTVQLSRESILINLSYVFYSDQDYKLWWRQEIYSTYYYLEVQFYSYAKLETRTSTCLNFLYLFTEYIINNLQ